MFTRPFFEPDRAAGLAFVEARGFGVVCAYDGVGLMVVGRAIRPQSLCE